MTQDVLRQIRPALVVFVLLSIITGIAYPLAVTGISMVVFPSAAEGSLIRGQEGKVIGSQLIGQGLLVFAIGHLPPLVVGIGLLTQPVAAAAIGWAAYGERLAIADGIGALLICAALVLIRLPPRGLASGRAEAQ